MSPEPYTEPLTEPPIRIKYPQRLATLQSIRARSREKKKVEFEEVREKTPLQSKVPHTSIVSEASVIAWRETTTAIAVPRLSRRPSNHQTHGKFSLKSRPRSRPAMTLVTFFGDPNRSER